MNIRDYQYLLAVAKHKHFGKAAQECYVSQPTLSTQLKKMEEQLGVQIFERGKKQVIITSIGQQIIDKAQELLNTHNQIKQTAKQFSDPLSGELKIGVFPTLAPYILPIITPQIKDNYPKLQLYIVEEKSDIILSKLKSGELDCILHALPLTAENLVIKHIFSEEFYLAVGPNHTLANIKSVTQKQLKGEQLLLLDDGHCLRDQALDVCNKVGATQEHSFKATSLETLRHMVAANTGITLIPQLAKKDNDGIKYMSFTAPAPQRDIAFIWRKSDARQGLYNSLTQILKKIQ